MGHQLLGDSQHLVQMLPDESIDLVITSPPFALLRKKDYGNKNQDEYVHWLKGFGEATLPKLKEKGSFVIDLGGAYKKGRPVRSLHNYLVLIDWVTELGYNLAEEFFWYNPAKLPSPIEWVNKRKIRVKDAVNTVWWFSKSDFPKADVTNVLKPYSERMKKLLDNPSGFYKPGKRPSGHDISSSFAKGNGGAIPPNLLEIPNTSSSSHYMRTTKALKRKRHPARFPSALPEFFIEFLTDRNDLVVDLFSGSNTTGYVAQKHGRHWISIEKRLDYAALSSVRFMEGVGLQDIGQAITEMESGVGLDLCGREQPQLVF